MITRAQFWLAYQAAMLENGKETPGEIVEDMLWNLFDKEDSASNQEKIGQPVTLKLGLSTPTPITPQKSMEDLLFAKAYKGKGMLMYFLEDGSMNTWISNALDFRDRLFIQDAIKRLIDKYVAEADEED